MKPMEFIIGQVLRWGLFLSVLTVLIGGTLYLIQNGHNPIHYHIFQPPSLAPTSISGIWHEAHLFSPQWIIQLGLLLLVITQVLRVALTTLLFVEERDYFFIAISTFILVVLIYSIFWRH